MSVQAPGRKLGIDVRHDSNGTTVLLSGPLLVRDANEVRRKLDAVVDRSPSSLMLDLASVTSLDVAGLAAVTAPALRVRRAAGDVMIVPPTNAEACRLVRRVGVVPVMNQLRR